MYDIEAPPGDDPLAHLVEQIDLRLHGLSSGERGAFVGSDLSAVDRVLGAIRAKDLASGPIFCEWGSGLGGVCGVASLNGFNPHGIEIQEHLVHAARSLATQLHLSMVFAAGTFLLPGDEDLAGTADSNTHLSFGNDAWEEIDVTPGECDLVFAYPWPGEESFVDNVFSRHASPDSLLLTFHDFDHVLVQRKFAGEVELVPLGWM